MDYLIPIACVAGGIWTGYLVGQFVGIKEMNWRLSVLAGERDEYKAGVEHWIEEADRMADVIGGLQAKVPARNVGGKFVAR